MNVALPKPGFGRLPDIPKSLSVKSTGGKNTAAAPSQLKASVSQNISTATLSNECRTRAATRKSSGPFVPATHTMGVNDFTRDRTVTVGHGTFAAMGGKYKLESDMGMTGRSTERLLKQHQAQQMAMLNQMNAMYGCNHAQQPQMSFMDFATGLLGIFKDSGLFGSEKGGKAKSTETASTVPSSDSNIAAMQNATTASDLSTAIEGAKGRLSEIGGKLSKATGSLQSLKGQTAGLTQTRDKASAALTQNKNDISQKKGEVQNNINSESAAQMAMNAAESQVEMLKDQLETAPDIVKAGLESSIKQAEAQFKQKKTQYEQAVQRREQSQQDLQSLMGQTQGLENAEKTAQADLDKNAQDIKSTENEIGNFQTLQKDMNEAIGQQETRLTELKDKEGKDKKA